MNHSIIFYVFQASAGTDDIYAERTSIHGQSKVYYITSRKDPDRCYAFCHKRRNNDGSRETVLCVTCIGAEKADRRASIIIRHQKLWCLSDGFIVGDRGVDDGHHVNCHSITKSAVIAELSKFDVINRIGNGADHARAHLAVG